MKENKYRKLASLKFLYEINKKGQIRNIKSKKYLTPYKDKDGYIKVHVRINKKDTSRFIHRLIAEAWIPVPEEYKSDIEKLQVNHKDYNRDNNSIANLEWCTAQENLDYSLNRRITALKNSEKNKASYKEIFSEYRNEYQRKLKIKEIDKEFNNSRDAAEYIVRNYFPDKNVDTVARTIRKTFKRSNKYAYGFTILYN